MTRVTDCVTIVTRVTDCVTIVTRVTDCVTIVTRVTDCVTIVTEREEQHSISIASWVASFPDATSPNDAPQALHHPNL